jgi:asparagine synthase (glutamine-hydrolysing)
MNSRDRYWRWCCFTDPALAARLLSGPIAEPGFTALRESCLSLINRDELNNILYADQHLVLVNDMLVKTDLMSMANGLEVRVPFLDHTVVDYLSGLPGDFKANGDKRKIILRETFGSLLPPEILTRPKHGFEVPLRKWFQHELRSLIQDDLLSDEFVRSQQIFNPEEIFRVKNKQFSSHPGDIHIQIWMLIVFQYWWKKYFV